MALDRAEAAARKALTLAPELADAHVSFAPILYNRYDWAGAERELRRAVALDPNSVLGNYWLAVVLSVHGRLDESLAISRKVAALDPLARQSALSPSVYLYLKRDYEGSIAYMDEVEKRIGIRSEFYQALCEIGLGRFGAAVENARKATSGPMERSAGRRAVLAIAYALAGRSEDSKRVLAPLMEEAEAGKAPAGVVAMAFAALGQSDRAFAWYDTAYAQRTVLGVEDLMVDPLLDPIRSDPRFPDLLRKFNHVP